MNRIETETPMLRLSKKLLFALEAVVDIAHNGGAEPVQSKEITRRQGIPQRYLEQVMQQLVHAEILEGVRGPRGGYRLARERRKITIGDIARVVRAMEKTDDPMADPAGSDLGHKVVRPVWQDIQDELMERLDGITVADLCQRAVEQGIRSEAMTRMDFSI